LRRKITVETNTSATLADQLKAPFPACDIEWRVGRAFSEDKGVLLPYVTARAILERLDDVFGVENWTAQYQTVEQGVICTITAVTEDGNTIVKSDGSGYTQVEPLKGGISGALKRTASALGIGRYLYDLGEVVAPLRNKKFYGEIELPDRFLPESERTGNTEIKVKSKSFSKNSGDSAPKANKGELTDEVKTALNFVVRNDKYNEGKKMRDVWDKGLRFLAHSRDAEQAKAARLVAGFKGVPVD